MLRTTIFCLVAAIPGLAFAEPAQDQFPRSALGVEVHGIDGTVIGRVSAVERDAQGNIVAVEVPGLEPEDAPSAVRSYVAENDADRRILVSERRAQRDPAGARDNRSR